MHSRLVSRIADSLHVPISLCLTSSDLNFKTFEFQTIEEKVTSPSYEKKYSETVLASEVETGVGAHGNRTYNFDIRIPPNVELPNFETCTLFQQYCELKVTYIPRYLPHIYQYNIKHTKFHTLGRGKSTWTSYEPEIGAEDQARTHTSKEHR